MSKKLGTAPYKGVRDFYPDDMAVQRYMFSVWEQTAESFGYARYDASVLEPAKLYRSKGAENAEMVNEQTYTFIDRGDREVTLRPEMTPTVARMIAGKQRELSFPVRWYSIPNLFRYERTQRGRLREHWQLNCDIFGVNDTAADIEILLLADAIFKNFGATAGEHYEVHISSRKLLDAVFATYNLKKDTATAITQLVDRKRKIPATEFTDTLQKLAPECAADLQQFFDSTSIEELPEALRNHDATKELEAILVALNVEFKLGVLFDPSIVRGFNYYTGTVFEVFDLHPDNNRALMGGGRYDNLTELFSTETIPGIGFGFGDVTLRDFLDSHNLLTADLPSPTLMIIPVDQSYNITGEKIAQQFRDAGVSVATDIGTKKLAKKISAAGDAFVDFIIVVGEDEITSQKFTMKNLTDGTEHSGTLEKFISKLS